MAETAQHKSQRSVSENTPFECRIAYPNVHRKRTKKANGRELKTPRNDAVLLVPKVHADPAQCPNYAWLANHCMQAAAKAWGSWPNGGHWPIQDGDKVPEAKAPVIPGQAPTPAKEYPWRKGNWVIEVTNVLEPGPRIAVIQNGQGIDLPAQTINGKEMYKSGDYGFANVSAYTFHNEKFGCNFGFDGILFTREGERIGAGPKSAAQMFAGVATFAAPMTAAAPPANAMPGQSPTPPMAPPVAPVAPPPMPAAAAPPIAPVAPVAPLPQAPVAPVAPLPPFPTPGR